MSKLNPLAQTIAKDIWETIPKKTTDDMCNVGDEAMFRGICLAITAQCELDGITVTWQEVEEFLICYMQDQTV